MRKLVIAGAVAALTLGGVTVASAVPVPNPDPCAYTGSLTDAKHQAYLKCRLDRIEQAIPGNQTVTVTAAPVTVTAPAVTVTVTASPEPTVAPTTDAAPSPSTSAPTSAPTTQAPPVGGWPNADNTGVPAGVTLTAYTGPLVITTANTVIDGKTITGDLEIRAAGVVIRNSRINGIVETTEDSTGYGYTIEDSEVHVGDRPGTGVGEVNFTMRRVEVSGGNRSVNCWKTCLIEDSWVHGQMSDESGQYHESGIRMGSGGVLRHNTIVCDAPEFAPEAGCSADLTGYGDFAAVQNMHMEGNLFKASRSGGFCAYGGSSGGKPFSSGARDIKFINNVFERGPGGKCGAYGPVTDFDPNKPGNQWTGNTWDDGSPVPSA